MNPKQLVVKLSDRSVPLNVIGVRVTVLVSDDVSKAQKITLQSGDEGAGPPPHSHPWDESFYVTKGQVQFICGGQTSTCLPGTLVHVPGGTVHAFSFGPGGGEMLEVTAKDSKAIQMFSALDREVPPGPPDVPKAIEVAGRYDVTFHL
ncbi:MAG: cupin domain-containing protein [Nitrospira sp.]|nr:cupin domain-containing protein [Nitrospira sp.]